MKYKGYVIPTLPKFSSAKTMKQKLLYIKRNRIYTSCSGIASICESPCSKCILQREKYFEISKILEDITDVNIRKEFKL